MQTITVKGSTGRSQILVGGRLADLSNYLPDARVVIITDEVVAGLYRDQFPEGDVITIGCGERNKTLETIAAIFEKLIELEADRSTFIVGIGGGIVGDITGFAASTYMRGLRFGFVATTLLAQVDASVGGKNGVNFKGYKNMVGVFNQPEFVIADIDLLKTLPPSEIACGLAEIVKHACISDKNYFDFIENQCRAIERLDHEVMLRLVYESVKIKAGVVNQDEKEAGRRRILNFGHTIGHALEKTTQVSHGQAISLGMVMAANLSNRKGLLHQSEVQRINSLLDRLNLPVETEFDRKTVFEALKKDKKRQRSHIHFILLNHLGSAIIEDIRIKELEDWILYGDA
jgi:3-dehydroquinate synthase